MSDHLPWMKFAPNSWRSDLALRRCSLGARGLWIEMIALGHLCEPYGHIAVNGEQMSLDELSVEVRSTPLEVQAYLAELEAAGVFSREEDGTIYSRKMVSDENKRLSKSRAGRLGGISAQATVLKQPCSSTTTQARSYSVSTSTSSSEDNGEADKSTAVKLLQLYYDGYAQRHCKPPQVAWNGKDLRVAMSLLAGPPARTLEALGAIVDAYLDSADSYVRDAGWPFALLPSRVNRLELVDQAGDAFEGARRG